MIDVSVTNESIILEPIPKKEDFKNLFHKTVATKVPTTFLALILIQSNLNFYTKFYLEFKVYAIGTICTPFYATIVMTYFEEIFIYTILAGKTYIPSIQR